MHFETLFDAYIRFPACEYSQSTYERLVELMGSVDQLEDDFKLEFSCGDGKYYSDYWRWTEGGALIANFHTDEEYEEVANYDGKVDLNYPPRTSSGEILERDRDYNFTVLSFDDEVAFFIDGKEISRVPKLYGTSIDTVI